MTGISAGTINTTFSYDANGNQTAGLGRSITWTSYNKPASITQGSRTLSFLDDPKHQRFQQVTPQGTTLYFDSFGAHAEFNPGSGQWNEYLKVGNVMVGVRFLALATETVTLRYFHTDHLGSIAVITDGNGAVAERLSYDAWGKRRFANGADDPAGSVTSQTTYGFTGQEELSVTGLVHLNGRVYDSLIGRMMSADPTVPDALNPQAWNRYSYVGNDPLTFTDPTGYSWLSSFFSSIGNFFKSIFSNAIVRAIVQIAIAAVLTLGNVPLAIAAAASTAIVTGLSGGKLGQILKAAVIAGATAFAFNQVGTAFAGPSNFLANVAGHAAVGCLSAVASGGKCGPGALSGAAGAAAAPLVGGLVQNAPDGFTRAIEGSALEGAVGGLASVAGGGKFADGAVTGAFGYLFNDLGHMLAGQDAHQALLTWLKTGGDGDLWSGNTTWDGLFGTGRPDLVYAGTNPLSVYEIKPDGSAAAGAAQLQRYLNTADEDAVAGDFFHIFRGAPSLTFSSQWFLGRTTYTYTPSSYLGVVTYTVDNQSVFQDISQAFRQRPVGAPSPLPLPPPVPVLP